MAAAASGASATSLADISGTSSQSDRLRKLTEELSSLLMEQAEVSREVNTLLTADGGLNEASKRSVKSLEAAVSPKVVLVARLLLHRGGVTGLSARESRWRASYRPVLASGHLPLARRLPSRGSPATSSTTRLLMQPAPWRRRTCCLPRLPAWPSSRSGWTPNKRSWTRRAARRPSPRQPWTCRTCGGGLRGTTAPLLRSAARGRRPRFRPRGECLAAPSTTPGSGPWRLTCGQAGPCADGSLRALLLGASGGARESVRVYVCDCAGVSV